MKRGQRRARAERWASKGVRVECRDSPGGRRQQPTVRNRRTAPTATRRNGQLRHARPVPVPGRSSPCLGGRSGGAAGRRMAKPMADRAAKKSDGPRVAAKPADGAGGPWRSRWSNAGQPRGGRSVATRAGHGAVGAPIATIARFGRLRRSQRDGRFQWRVWPPPPIQWRSLVRSSIGAYGSSGPTFGST